MENPQEEILVSPAFSLLEFGDGYIAMILGGIEGEDSAGLKVVDFIIKPSQLLRKRYNIKDSQLNKNECMPYRVYKSDLIPINQFDDANRKWMYIKNFNHEDTEISKIEWNLRNLLKESEKRVALLEGDILWYYDQLQLAKMNPSEFMAQSFEFFDKMGSINEKMLGRKEKEQFLS